MSTSDTSSTEGSGGGIGSKIRSEFEYRWQLQITITNIYYPVKSGRRSRTRYVPFKLFYLLTHHRDTGVGDNIRGTFLGAVDTATGHQSENADIAARGRMEASQGMAKMRGAGTETTAGSELGEKPFGMDAISHGNGDGAQGVGGGKQPGQYGDTGTGGATTGYQSGGREFGMGTSVAGNQGGTPGTQGTQQGQYADASASGATTGSQSRSRSFGVGTSTAGNQGGTQGTQITQQGQYADAGTIGGYGNQASDAGGMGSIGTQPTQSDYQQRDQHEGSLRGVNGDGYGQSKSGTENKGQSEGAY